MNPLVKNNIFLLIVLLSASCLAQDSLDIYTKGREIYTYRKEKIILNFDDEIKNCKYDYLNKKYKSKRKEGIQFNLCRKAILLFPKDSIYKILDKDQLNNYFFTTIAGVEDKVKTFRNMTYMKLPPNYKSEKVYQAYDRNDIFNTYLIEDIGNGEVIRYPIIWRNEGVTP